MVGAGKGRADKPLDLSFGLGVEGGVREDDGEDGGIES